MFPLVLGRGTISQLRAVAPSSEMRMGCRTLTPEPEATTPVMMGKREPPIWAKTKTKARAVERESGWKSLEATLMPWGGQR